MWHLQQAQTNSNSGKTLKFVRLQMLTNSNSDITLKVGQAAEFKFYFKPLQVILQSLQELFQKAIAGFDCKINGQAFGAAVLHSLAQWAGIMS